MNNSKEYMRYCLLYEFQLGHSAAEAHRNMTVVFAKDCYSESHCRSYFTRFRNGNFSLENEPHSGRPIEIDQDALCDTLKCEPHQSTRELASKLGCDQSTIVRQLAKLGYSQKLGKWVPHRLSADQKEQRSNICSSLISRSRRFRLA